MLASHSELSSKIESLVTAQDKLESTLNARISEVMGAIKEQKAEIKALQAEDTALQGNEQLHQKRLDDLEDRIRHLHLIIFGFPEPGREYAEELKKQKTEKLIGQRLGVVTNSVEIVHRIGAKATIKHDM